MKKFWSLLTKKEIKHLRDMGITNIAGFKRVRDAQNKHDKENPGMRACHDCNNIAFKTGIK